MPDIIVKKDGTDYSLQTMPLHYPADRVTYVNTDSGLSSNNVQGAIDELADGIKEITDAIITIYTSGKTLNTSYTEDLPTGFTQDNSLISGIMYSVFNSNYSSINIATDLNLQIEISINSNNKLQYKLVGQYTNQGKLTISLKKI